MWSEYSIGTWSQSLDKSTERMAYSTSTKIRSQAQTTKPTDPESNIHWLWNLTTFHGKDRKEMQSPYSRMYTICATFQLEDYYKPDICDAHNMMITKNVQQNYPISSKYAGARLSLQCNPEWTILRTESPRKAFLKRWKTDPAISSWFESGCQSESCQALTVVSQQFSNMRATGRE